MTSVTGIVEFTDNSLLIVQREGILPDPVLYIVKKNFSDIFVITWPKIVWGRVKDRHQERESAPYFKLFIKKGENASQELKTWIEYQLW